MKASFRNGFLREKAGNEGGAGSGAAKQSPEGAKAEAEAGGEEKEGEEADPDPEAGSEKEGEEKPEAKGATLLQRISARMQTSAQLTNRALTAEAQVKELQGQLAASKGREAKLSAELDQLKGEQAELEQLLETSEKEVKAEKEKNTTVEGKAAEIVAGMGIPAAELPATEREDQSLEGLHAQLKAETNPTKRYELAAKINAIEFGTAASN